MLNRIAEKARAEFLSSATWTYADYLKTDHWHLQRRLAYRRASWRCQLCNAEKVELNAHHRDYSRLGRELPEDLIVLCRACHEKFHDKQPQPPQ